MTDEAQAATGEKPATHAFQADVARLLDLMVHSIYSERDIFIRELISNAADACEKLRYEAIAHPDLVADGAPFGIAVSLDKERGTLTIADNGIGMDEADLVSALGTIASSGTKAFLDRLNADEDKKAEASNLIGQFGIGFYSAFMVADQVVVETRRAGADQAWRWTSDGKGSYVIEPLDLAVAPARGTRVTLHMKDDATEFLDAYRAEAVVKEHSGAVAVPISFLDKPDGEGKSLTDGAALWAKSKTDVTPEQYTEFYRTLAGQFDEPALTVHWRAEGRYEYNALAFVPGSRPFDLFDPARKGRAKLYVRRVLITADADLLPGWLRFVRLVVDTADLPLNVSREIVQQSPVFAAIKKGVTTRVMSELTKLADTDPDAFGKIWDTFGAVIKEGLYEDYERRDALYKLARFASSTHPDGTRTLAGYVADLRPNQTAIYYILGDDAKRLAQSPQLEGFRARGIEVLLLPDPVDAFWVGTAVGFDGKPFKSVTQGAADIKLVPLAQGQDAPKTEDVSPTVATLLAFMKQTLAEAVEDVRASDRLSESPACLVAPENGPDRRLERILSQHGRVEELSKPVLEVNPGHPLVTALAATFGRDADKAVVEDSTWLLLDEARIVDGEAPKDPMAFAARLRRVLERAAG
ncbi:molecular chaperone HtpG [Lichenihabitans sp. Uapishka_5]|uniref:molecular chaperone HtpG n=1 Tax=Lichenihabitans sp. Uapishka_5 TaxID=3037302 RepID=UPI0029E7FDD5|nr:molecular chaperone HtpG [Lichenihabitans sp. Uapishka_5]MDX7951409.1 molecular chaperone HtpG [Lichenihabitans sp. Uapishka_5]